MSGTTLGMFIISACPRDHSRDAIDGEGGRFRHRFECFVCIDSLNAHNDTMREALSLFVFYKEGN